MLVLICSLHARSFRHLPPSTDLHASPLSRVKTESRAPAKPIKGLDHEYHSGAEVIEPLRKNIELFRHQSVIGGKAGAGLILLEPKHILEREQSQALEKVRQ